LEVGDELLVAADAGCVCDLAARAADTCDQRPSRASRDLRNDAGVDLSMCNGSKAGEEDGR